MEIRDYVIKNFKGSNEKDIQSSIEASIKEKNEEALPGLGVLFELLWNSSNKEERNDIISKLSSKLK